MGWNHEDAPSHEGYVVATVERVDERGRVREGFWREVTSDEKRVGVTHLQAGCDCGWRSPRFEVWPGVECDGYVYCAEHDRDRARSLWDEHISLELMRERGRGMPRL